MSDQQHAQQIANGNSNIQAGRDVHINTSDSSDPITDFDEDNPNIINCPQCWKKTGRYSDYCPHCGFGVIKHFSRMDWLEQVSLSKKHAFRHEAFGTFFIIGGPITINTIQSLSESASQGPLITLSIIIGLVLFKTGRGIRGSIEPFE